MKLLVFAHTPPPLHGQSAMVAMLVDGLRGDPHFEVLHVNVRLSTDAADIGRWRLGKLRPLLAACFAAWRLRWRHGPAVFYYVPAPGKRSALYRDFVVMMLCRPFFSRVVLHWHAVGLGGWLETSANVIERWLARRLLGRADLAIVLADELADDARKFSPQRVAVVRNTIQSDPAPPTRGGKANASSYNVLFLGLCSREKGVFDTMEAIALANANGGRFHLDVAGPFTSRADEDEFRTRAAMLPPDSVTYHGQVDAARKATLFQTADVFCFPTYYPHEGQPLVVIEALAYDIPIVTTRWRAIPSLLPPSFAWTVEPRQPPQLAAALAAAQSAGRPNGALRRHYLAYFSPEQHVAALKAALLSVAN
jgi:glycosyltransferase involved in cell wall biosynthesis